MDSGWGTLKRFLAYKCEHAARSFEVVDERYSTVTVLIAEPERSARSQRVDCKIMGML